MKNKKGGIFLISIIIFILFLAGLAWFLKNMNVETDVNVDFSRKDATTNNTESAASAKCLEDGFTLELRLNQENELYGVCIDDNKTECDEWEYYSGECILTNTQGETTVNEVDP